MQKTLTTELKRLRRENNLSQAELADRLNMKRTTYAQKEAKGSFESFELEVLSRIFSINIEVLQAMSHVKGELQGIVHNPDEYRTIQALKLEAMIRIAMTQNAEILAHIRQQPIEKVLQEAEGAVVQEIATLLKKL